MEDLARKRSSGVDVHPTSDDGSYQSPLRIDGHVRRQKHLIKEAVCNGTQQAASNIPRVPCDVRFVRRHVSGVSWWCQFRTDSPIKSRGSKLVMDSLILLDKIEGKSTLEEAPMSIFSPGRGAGDRCVVCQESFSLQALRHAKMVGEEQTPWSKRKT